MDQFLDIGPVDPSLETPIFKVYYGVRYEALLDHLRIRPEATGDGKCVQYDGDWYTASGAARMIVQSYSKSVNGWKQFWRYTRSDGSCGPIEEIRDSRGRL